MSLLFVDYDQGAGGEYFCFALSQSPQCYNVKTILHSDRTKIIDRFQQEFLKPFPVVDKNLYDDGLLYHVVPSHRNTHLAKEVFTNIKSIRISAPSDPVYWDFLKKQQIKKVFLETEPTDEYFFGLLKILAQRFGGTDFVKKVKRSMDNLTIELLARGLEPSDENKNKYIQDLYNQRYPEPDFDYDLIIPYEHLFNNVSKVAEDIQKTFHIDVSLEHFAKYQTDYELYLSET